MEASKPRLYRKGLQNLACTGRGLNSCGALYVKSFWCPLCQEFLVPFLSRIFGALEFKSFSCPLMFGSLSLTDYIKKNSEKEPMIFIGPTNREAAIEASSKSAVASGA